ncbi:unnamed protein product, partial [Mesorhabditis spiculigera]
MSTADVQTGTTHPATAFSILAAELFYLVAGAIWIGSLSRSTPDVVYQLREFYAPLSVFPQFAGWVCTGLILLILVLIISLSCVFIGLVRSVPRVIYHHCFLLYAQWPMTLMILVGGVVDWGPFHVAVMLLIYFSGLAGFAHLYHYVTWIPTFGVAIIHSA